MSVARARCIPAARSAFVGLGSSRTATTTALAMIGAGPSAGLVQSAWLRSASTSSLSSRQLSGGGKGARRYPIGTCPVCTGSVANRRSGLRSYTSSAHPHAPQKSDSRSLHQQTTPAGFSAPSPPDIAILNTRPQSDSQAPFRGADLKPESQQGSQEEQSPACATLSPSSPSAPKTQQNNAPATQTKPDVASAAAATATAPASTSTSSKRSGSAFRPRKAALSLTPKAVERLMALSESPSGPKLIRVGVRNKGCAGMSYHLEYVAPQQAGKFDEKVEQDGVKVLIDSKALFSIIGSEMDWKDDKLSSKFVFNNPNIKEACGCGESFLT